MTRIYDTQLHLDCQHLKQAPYPHCPWYPSKPLPLSTNSPHTPHQFSQSWVSCPSFTEKLKLIRPHIPSYVPGTSYCTPIPILSSLYKTSEVCIHLTFSHPLVLCVIGCTPPRCPPLQYLLSLGSTPVPVVSPWQVNMVAPLVIQCMYLNPVIFPTYHPISSLCTSILSQASLQRHLPTSSKIVFAT